MNKGKKRVLPQTFTVQEVAEHLKVTEITIYRLLKKGEIVGYKVGDSWRIDEKDLKAYIKRQKKKRSFKL
ncbi:MAG: helix-turn-helix domain-containing protein [Candidatus Aerophobetes bacterium]|nr:helix-turn-helix domain-containing protein [Candidatus Aerophobetes bacterium]